MKLRKLSGIALVALVLGHLPASAATVIHGTSDGAHIVFDQPASVFQPGKTKVSLDINAGNFVDAAVSLYTIYSYSIFYSHPPYSPDVDYGNSTSASEGCWFGSGPITCDNGFGEQPQYLTNFLIGPKHLEFTVDLPRSYDKCGSVFNRNCMESWTPIHSISASLTGPSSYKLTYDNLSAVPEPASWTMMIAGFGMVGALTRKRRQAGEQGLAEA